VLGKRTFRETETMAASSSIADQGYPKTLIASDGAQIRMPGVGQDIDAGHRVGVGATADRSIALIEARPFARECIRLSMQPTSRLLTPRPSNR
jgi:hypothetical protein